MEQQKNKTSLIVIIAVLILLAIGGSGAYAYVANRNKNSEENARMKDDSTLKPTEAMMKDKATATPVPGQSTDDSKMIKSGFYTDYDQAKLVNAKDGKVVLFFKANWCPTCQSVDKDITSNLGKIPADVSLLKVDYDNSNDLKKKYGVTYQHTFVEVNEKGEQIKKWSSSPTLNDILKQI